MLIISILFQNNHAEILDAVVVGGGLSALTTAYRLAQGGLNIELLDGDENLGGRARSVIFNEKSFAVGGTFTLFENTFILQLANEVGALPIVPPVIPKELAIIRIATNPYLLLKLWLIGYNMTLRDDYWNSENAIEYDTVSIEEWLQRERRVFSWPEDALQAVRDYYWLLESFDIKQTSWSALHGAVMLHKRLRLLSAEGLYTKGFFRWENGTGTLVNAIANGIRHLGGTISSSSRVIAINYTIPDQIKITLANGQSKIAKKVVIATSLTSSGYIAYTPSLPTNPNYMKLFESNLYIDYVVIQLIMSWSKKWYLLQGNAILPDPVQQPSCGVYGPVFDETPANSVGGDLRILVVDTNRSYECLIQNQTSNLTVYDLITKSAKDWFKSMYSVLGIPLGSYDIDSSFLQTNIWDWRTLKSLIPAPVYYYAPVANRIYWAGSERSVNGLYWMEGAVQRGNDAACEVLADFGLVPNCTEYSNWIEYLGLLARNTTYFQNLDKKYDSNLNIISLYACQILTQSGYACISQKQPWRQPINAIEQQIKTLADGALIQLAEIDGLIKSAAVLIGDLIGLDFFKNK